MGDRWVTQKELAELVAQESELSIRQSRKAVSALFSVIRKSLEHGESISITKVGTFEPKIIPRGRFQSNLDGRIYDTPPKLDIGFRQYESSKKL